MSLSIYNIPVFNGSATYVLNDIVSYNGIWNGFNLSPIGYLYNISPGLGGASPGNQSWVGYTTYAGEMKPYFTWIPSYQSQSQQNPKVLSTRFSDGYESRMADGINNDLLVLEYTFESRSIAETTAIIHFLTQRNGTESFVLTPQPPFATAKKFVCRSWRQSQAFYGNFNIQATFEEVPN